MSTYDTKHTPTPWKEGSFYGIVDADGEGICFYTIDDDGIHFKGNAKEMILRAVNSHEALLKAAKYFKKRYESAMHSEYDFPNDEWSYEREGDKESLRHAKAVAKAEGK
jgi:hypothetical protein